MTKSLRLVLYIHALAGGGAERVWSVLASSLAKRGHEVILAVDYEAEENRTYLQPNVRLVVLGGSHAQTIGRLARLLATEKPDVALSALSASNVKLTLAALLAGCLGRTVLTYHGYAGSEPQRLSQLGFGLAALLTRLTARTICVSDGLLRYLRDSCWASPSRSLRIYNPVLAEGAERPVDHTALRSRAPVVLAAGRFADYKNFAGLLRAFAAMNDAEARLVLIGDGPERRNLLVEVDRLGLRGRVEMPGYVTQPWRYFEQAKCFVLPSRSESFGLVLVEAMAHGLPVVATDCDGPREILSHGTYGTLVPHDDPAALAAAISRALEEPGDPASRIARARHFDVDVAASQYEALFRSVVAGASKSPSLARLTAALFPPTPR
ncbi:glycosyltransferase [Lichenifustis flavocetrariae]|uniref:Glycosyltransferase n=1 Tax=Lichenifustis flavocetrariae TaxID=2949735 RepID=A0AA42CLH2_9HYPH|nr:glycosyltransferase [Lichenifustis flavocetrariae]MCW6507367.1 glycosyltransferase [Lichenifustis flavocetrariae]